MRNHHLFTRRNLEVAGRLLDLVARHNMVMALPAGLPTLEAMATKNRTRVDNMFCDDRTLEQILVCKTREDWRPVKTDHFPVLTTLQMSTQRGTFSPRPDWKEFNGALLDSLLQPVPMNEITDKEEAEKRLTMLSKSITDVIQDKVPLTKPSPYAKRWWNEELSKMRTEVKRMARRAMKVRGLQGHPDLARHAEIRNRYAEAIRKAKDDHWAKWLAKLDTSTVWDANRLIRAEPSDGGGSCMPTLRSRNPTTRLAESTARSNEEKACTLHNSFFPPKPLVSSVPEEFEYPEPRWVHEVVTNEQILAAIKKMQPDKGHRPQLRVAASC